jgi:hypothetical protein
MDSWYALVLIAGVLFLTGQFYIRLRWYRSPEVYQAMLGVAACYFIAGAFAGVAALHFSQARLAAQRAQHPALPTAASGRVIDVGYMTRGRP